MTFSPEMKMGVYSRYCLVVSDAIVTSTVVCSSILFATPMNSKLCPVKYPSLMSYLSRCLEVYFARVGL